MARLSWLAQARALAWLRWRQWRNSLRSSGGLANTIVAALMGLGGTVAALAMAAGAGLASFSLRRGGDQDVFQIAQYAIIWMLAFLAVVVPLIVAHGRPQIELRKLLSLPISRRALLGLSLFGALTSGSNLFWYPTLVALTLGGQPLSSWPLALLLALVLCLCLVSWGHALTLGLERLMQRRRTKELLGIVGLSLLILLSVAPALMENRVAGGFEGFWERFQAPGWVGMTIGVLPPSLGARGLGALAGGELGVGMRATLGLALWSLAALALARLLFVGLLRGGTSAGRVARLRKAPQATGPDLAALLPTDLAGVLGKELRYLTRSALGRLNLVLMPVMTAVVAVAFARDIDVELFGRQPVELALFGMLLYGSLLSSNQCVNAFAWDGPGVASYLLAPIEPSRVLLGKNLALWLYNLLLLLLALAGWSLLAGGPGLLSLLEASLVMCLALVNLCSVGNFLSLLFPIRRPIGSVMNPPSQVAMLGSFGTLLVSAALTAAALAVGTRLPLGGLRPLPLLLAFGLTLLGYRLLLPLAARLLEQRREQLLQRLTANS